MKKTYLVLAHDKPLQLKRLITALDDGESYFDVHVDGKTDITPFTDLIKMENMNFLSDRHVCAWGGFSIVEATLSLFRNFIQNKTGSEYGILLSGQHYPLVSNRKINQFLESNAGANYQSTWPISGAWTPLERDIRLRFYRFDLSSDRFDYAFLPHIGSEYLREEHFFNDLKKLLNDPRLDIAFKNDVLKTISIPRKLPEIPIYGGPQWFSFNSDMIMKMNSFLSENHNFIDYFRFSHVSDELLFPTLIKHLQSADPGIIIKDSLTYADWWSEERKPAIFEMGNYADLNEASQQYLFARKFDMEISADLLNLIDSNRK